MKAQEEQGEDANSLHEESHVSDRHMMWWRNAWWIRIDSGPHLRTARDRRRAWRAATSRAGSARNKKGLRGRKGEMGDGKQRAIRCTSYCTYTNSNSNKHDRRSSNSSSIRSNATAVIAVQISAGGRDVPVMLFNEACHRNVDLERPMYYNEANDGRYVHRAILLDFEPGITAFVRDRSDSLSRRTTLCSGRLARTTIGRRDTASKVQNSSTLCWMW